MLKRILAGLIIGLATHTAPMWAASEPSALFQQDGIINGFGAQAYHFNLDYSGELRAILSDESVALFQGFDNLALSLFQLGGTGYTLKGYIGQPGSFTFKATAGNYVATVFGNAKGSAAAGRFDVLVRAVPEPSQWVLMLIGMGMVGYALRRRHSTQPKSKNSAQPLSIAA